MNVSVVYFVFFYFEGIISFVCVCISVFFKFGFTLNLVCENRTLVVGGISV